MHRYSRVDSNSWARARTEIESNCITCRYKRMCLCHMSSHIHLDCRPILAVSEPLFSGLAVRHVLVVGRRRCSTGHCWVSLIPEAAHSHQTFLDVRSNGTHSVPRKQQNLQPIVPLARLVWIVYLARNIHQRSRPGGPFAEP